MLEQEKNKEIIQEEIKLIVKKDIQDKLLDRIIELENILKKKNNDIFNLTYENRNLKQKLDNIKYSKNNELNYSNKESHNCKKLKRRYFKWSGFHY